LTLEQADAVGQFSQPGLGVRAAALAQAVVGETDE
jgi:hypothetical protein